MIELSYVIVNWNTKNLVLQCIGSIKKQNIHCEYEIIVVDNGSEDDSVQAVSERYPDTLIIENRENLGFSKANNIGIRASRGTFICIVNSDIVVLRGIDAIIDYINNQREVGLVGPKVLNGDLTLRHNCRRFPSLWNTFCLALSLHKLFPKSPMLNGTLMTYFPHDEIKKVDVLPGCFLLARKEALDQVGLLDERFFIYGEDKDWCRRFWQNDWEVVFFPHTEVIHFAKGSSSKAPARFAVEKLKANYQYWEKHHRPFERRLFIMIMIMHYTIRLVGWLVVYLAKPGSRSDSLISINANAACSRWAAGHFF